MKNLNSFLPLLCFATGIDMLGLNRMLSPDNEIASIPKPRAPGHSIEDPYRLLPQQEEDIKTNMKQIGSPANDRFPRLKEVKTLEEIEGFPILVKYKSLDGLGTFLYCWVDHDQDAKVDRWMVFNVPSNMLMSYLQGISTFWKVICSAKSNKIYLRDIGPDGKIVRTAIIGPNNLPEDYRPSIDSKHFKKDRLISQKTKEKRKNKLDRRQSTKKRRGF